MAETIDLVRDFILYGPLYRTYTLKTSNNQDDEFYSCLRYFKGHLDCYCLGCEKPSVFNYYNEDLSFSIGGEYYFGHIFECSRNENHTLLFLFQRINSEDTFTVQKIAQFPSIADIAFEELQKYRKILGKERYPEFTRAIGLVSHGVGIGAFVYLRRVFEGLIEDAQKKARNNKGWNEELFINAHMEEKIKQLEDFLPEFLVENRSIYSILSKGIHELSEHECLAFFPVIREGIEAILEERLEQKKKEERKKSVKRTIQKVKDTMSGDSKKDQ